MMRPIFKLDENGLAIPELQVGTSWVMLNANVLMSVALDGLLVRTRWTQGSGQFGGWELLRQNEDLNDWDNPIAVDTADPNEKQALTAFNARNTKMTGKYLVYGEGINGNPHNLVGTHFARFEPMHHFLIVLKDKTIVNRSSYTTVKGFYDSIKRELEESPEIMGLNFHIEDQKMKILNMAGVTRQQFGLQWPVETTSTVVDLTKIVTPKPYLIDDDNDTWGLPC